MIKNYLKVFFRSLWKQKGNSLINIIGLSVGIACSIFVFLWVQDEFSYEDFHVNKNQLHVVVQNQNFKTGKVTLWTTPPAIADFLKKDYPEITNVARVIFTPCFIKSNESNFTETVYCADPSFLEMFTYPLVKGDPRNVFPDVSSIVITERMAKKCFGNADPIGKTLVINALAKDFTFKVSGILKNIPHNTSLQCDFLVPMDFVKTIGFNLEEWGVSDFLTFVQLQENASYKEVSKKIFDLFRIHKSPKNIRDLFLHPLTRVRLYAIDGNGGGIVFIRLFILIALLVLIIACINFVNLATCRTINRAKEVGIRKVVGARRINLIYQFFGESTIMVAMAMLLAIIWVILAMPFFNAISGKQFTLDFFSTGLLLGLVYIAIFVCFAAGSYPALYLSSFNPVKVIKGMGRGLGRKVWLRRSLVFVQFTISVALIISTVVVYKQLEFLKNKNLGLDKNNII
ncbi:MAG TPA: ABC transporter permease, partial [Candidatus Kapabacteria bacterium]|nr:ABC transporter permease [Candidatus Kapabacteria bacterium]